MPRIEISFENGSPRAANRRSDTLRPGEVTALVAVDSAVSAEQFSPPGERFIPLESGRWAVGRGLNDGRVVWRIADEGDCERLHHPCWLWTKEEWFLAPPEQKLGRTAMPTPVPLRSLLRLARPIAGSRQTTNEALAEVIQELRKGRRPVAAVVPRMEHCAEFTRWFAFALISCLPPSQRNALRISTFEANPNPANWDIVFTDHEPKEGFTCIDLRRPKPKSTDMVVYYVLNRLNANDTEALEYTAFLEDGESPDPWGDGVKAHLQAGIPGISAIDAELVEHAPEQAIEAVLARIRSGCFVDQEVAQDLALITRKTGDARPWRALVSRSAEERLNALTAWLPYASQTKPNHSLLRTISALYPREESPEPWFRALLAWYDEGYALEIIKEILASTLIDADHKASLPVNAAIWCELILTLTRKGRPEEAIEALLSPVADAIAQAGLARSLILCWLSIPKRHRAKEHLVDLIDLFVDAPDGDVACAMLFRNLLRDDATAAIDVLLQQWASLHPDGNIREDDALLQTIIECDQLERWVYATAAISDPEDVVTAVSAYISGPDDPLWIVAEQASAENSNLSGRERFIHLAYFLPEAIEALESVGLFLANRALQEAALPDPELAEVVTEFTDLADANTLWMWLAVSTSEPERFSEATLDLSVNAFAESPPAEEPLRAAALHAAAALGLSSAWNDSDLAAWIVRLCLAPDGDGTGFNYDLARAIVHALPDRADGVTTLATITNSLTGLPVDHPVLWIFLEYLLPDAWPGEVPSSYLGQVKVHTMADEVHAAWVKALE